MYTVLKTRKIQGDLIEHDPIVIWGDEDFKNYNFNGTGTKNNPYMISNYLINTSTSLTGIYIANTTKHFEIQNCKIDAVDYGIFIDNAANSTVKIINNICILNFKDGIFIRNSPHSEIISNLPFSNSESGIYLEGSPKSILCSNTCSDNGLTGIRIINSQSTSVLENVCVKSVDGIIIENSEYSLIKNNLCKRNYGQMIFYMGGFAIEGQGIGIFSSNNTIIDSNNCNDNFPMSEFYDHSWGGNEMFGISIYGSYNCTISSNTCYNNGKSGINLQDSSGIALNNTCSYNVLGISAGSDWDLSDDSNFTLFNNTCSNNGWAGIKTGSNSTLLNNTCSNNGWAGIETGNNVTLINNTLYNCGLVLSGDSIEDYLTYIIEDNWMNDKELGFFVNLVNPIFSNPIYGQLILINCTNAIVSNQNISNTKTGLFLKWCNNSTLLNNICNNNEIGIDTDSSSTLINNTCNNNYRDGIIAGSNSTIFNNTCNNNWQGIGISAGSNSTLLKNTCNNNHIGISASSNSTLLNNTCSNNRHPGIFLSRADFCVISFNLLKENGDYGVCLRFSNNNTIHHNNFIDNNLGGSSQALDNGANNTWYDKSAMEGNYYSDYSGVGNYSIDGSAGSEDPYPFLNPLPLSLIYMDAAIKNSYNRNYQILTPIIISFSKCFEISFSKDICFNCFSSFQIYIETKISSFVMKKKVIV